MSVTTPSFATNGQRFMSRAAAAIRAGTNPADAEIPGWPMPPKPPVRHLIPALSVRSVNGESLLIHAERCLLPKIFLCRICLCSSDGDS